MMNLRTLSLLGLTTMFLSPLMAQEERVFSAPMPGEVIHSEPIHSPPMYSEPMYDEPMYDEPFHGEIVQGPIFVDSAPIPLFTNVKYVQKRKMHPCAVTKIIRVNDPCACKSGCAPQCVYIEICVPPCDNEKRIRCRRDGDRLKYDYGKYEVNIRVRKGFIVVDYDR